MTWEEIDDLEEEYDVHRLLKNSHKKTDRTEKKNDTTREKHCAPKKVIHWKQIRTAFLRSYVKKLVTRIKQKVETNILGAINLVSLNLGCIT